MIGKLADLCVWDTDFLTCADDQIQQAQCLASYME